MGPDGTLDRWFARTLGLDAASLGRSSIERIVAAAIKHSGAADTEAYLELLANSPEESERFLEELLVPETWFFRDEEPFVFLRRHLEEAWLPAHPGQVLRVLSAPCSTGEEPYSIAMTLLEAGIPAEGFVLDAADISRRALAAAKRAVYGRSSFRQPLGESREALFQAASRGRRPTEAVTRTVRFHRANLIAPDFFAAEAPYDIIFCRNIFIYLTAKARLKLLANIERLLAPEGLLFTGHAEVGILQMEGFDAVRHPRAFACRRKAKAAAPRTAPWTRPAAAPLPAAVAPTAPPPPAKRVRPAEEAAPPRPEKKGAAARARALHGEALALADQGRFAEAEALCRQALSRERPHADLYCLMGLIHEAARRPDEAEACYLKALYLDPDHYETLVQVSLLYRQRGNDRKARMYLRRAEALERRPDGTNGP
ncbi:MAG: tetratricopeptide repeat protein [Deltaproteobacteria bacterium]|nr:tetratricopeptide repeat protein [Deltaproteobacteria bacterium]